MAVAILNHIAIYVYTLTNKKDCSSCTHTNYEMDHFSGRGHRIMHLYYVQNVLQNQN